MIPLVEWKVDIFHLVQEGINHNSLYVGCYIIFPFDYFSIFICYELVGCQHVVISSSWERLKAFFGCLFQLCGVPNVKVSFSMLTDVERPAYRIPAFGVTVQSASFASHLLISLHHVTDLIFGKKVPKLLGSVPSIGSLSIVTITHRTVSFTFQYIAACATPTSILPKMDLSSLYGTQL